MFLAGKCHALSFRFSFFLVIGSIVCLLKVVASTESKDAFSYLYRSDKLYGDIVSDRVLNQRSKIPPLSRIEDIRAREEVRSLFHHAYLSYMKVYPADEVKPVSCSPRFREESNPRGDIDEVMGNYLLTQIDSLSTLAVMNEFKEFNDAIKRVIRDFDPKKNFTVSVFEVTIRIVGGLTSAHTIAELLRDSPELFKVQKQPFFSRVSPDLPDFSWYSSQLLDLAEETILHLLPAFLTPTGVPHGKINLMSGVPKPKSHVTCLACAGTLLMEFGAVSRLSKTPIYELSAKRSMNHLLNRRSKLNLPGGLLDAVSGEWTSFDSSIGAGGDSFFEYILKSHILLQYSSYFDDFRMTYEAVETLMKQDNKHFAVDSRSGTKTKHHIDSLQAFWPGLQVLYGDVASAIESHAFFQKIFRAANFVPETYWPAQNLFDSNNDDYLLRPEFIESTYFLFQATGHRFYQEIGREFTKKLKTLCMTNCGFASYGISDGKLDDRMDSFFLAETLKYLFLLFDSDNWIHHGNFIFTTEGHPIPINKMNPSWTFAVPLETCSLLDHEAITRRLHSLYTEYYGSHSGSFSSIPLTELRSIGPMLDLEFQSVESRNSLLQEEFVVGLQGKIRAHQFSKSPHPETFLDQDVDEPFFEGVLLPNLRSCHDQVDQRKTLFSAQLQISNRTVIFLETGVCDVLRKIANVQHVYPYNPIGITLSDAAFYQIFSHEHSDLLAVFIKVPILIIHTQVSPQVLSHNHLSLFTVSPSHETLVFSSIFPPEANDVSNFFSAIFPTKSKP